MRHQVREVKPRIKFYKYANPSPEAIPSLWMELSGMASLTTPDRAVGVHLRRSQLLDGVPPWQLPAVLDSLACEGATA